MCGNSRATLSVPTLSCATAASSSTIHFSRIANGAVHSACGRGGGGKQRTRQPLACEPCNGLYEARNALRRNRLVATRQQEVGPIYAPPSDASWVQAWDVTERMLGLLRDEVVAGGARFELLVLTNGSQVHPDPAASRSSEELRSIGSPISRSAPRCVREIDGY